MTGSDAKTLHFEPNNTLTRAQAAVALTRALGIDVAPARGVFADVPASHWAAGAIEALADKGVVNGTGKNLFSPDLPVTREHMRIMIGRALSDAIATAAVPPEAEDASAMSRGQAAQALARTYRARLELP